MKTATVRALLMQSVSKTNLIYMALGAGITAVFAVAGRDPGAPPPSSSKVDPLYVVMEQSLPDGTTSGDLYLAGVALALRCKLPAFGTLSKSSIEGEHFLVVSAEINDVNLVSLSCILNDERSGVEKSISYYPSGDRLFTPVM